MRKIFKDASRNVRRLQFSNQKNKGQWGKRKEAILLNRPSSCRSIPLFHPVSARGMGLGLSKEEKLHESVRQGDVESMRLLVRSGAKLNWTIYGKTALVLACSSPHLLDAAVELINMGVDVNYCDPDTQTWTAIQMAARKGLLQTVNMLLLHGANPLIHLGSERNALEIARHKGFVEIVCAIERNICFFSGWLRNFHDTDHGAWEKIWAVVLPGGTSLSMDVTKLKIAIYHHHHHAKPSKTLSIRHYTFRRPDFSHHDPELVLVDNSIFASGAPLTLRSGKEGDTEQLKLLYNACIGMIRTNNYFRAATEPAEDVGSISQEESETAAAMVTSIQTATAEGVPISVVGFKGQGDVTDCDSFPLTKKEWINEKSTTTLSSSCVICTDNCADTVCVPCGHLSGCMACLREVERKKIGCPVCRAHIERILKIYTV